MITFFATLRKFLKALFHAAQDSEFRVLAFVCIGFLISGTIFYGAIEGWSLVDSLYFCVMTMTTIGYGDLVPGSNFSKIFTVFYAFSSIGVFVVLAAKLAAEMLKPKHHFHKKNKYVPYVCIGFLISGTIFYSTIEGWSLVDSLYFCVMTMTTIGYGDLAPGSNFSKIFTIMYAFSSIGVFVSLAAKLAAEMMKPKHRFHKKNKDEL